MSSERDVLDAFEGLKALRGRLSRLLEWAGPPVPPLLELLATRTAGGYTEQLVQYRNLEQEMVKAFLLVPDGAGPFPGVVVHHQHNAEWHLGKSEVAGHAGNPLQAFGPALAQRGVVVLAPDTICFEDRRRNASGTRPAQDDDAQHYNEAVSRLVRGSLLMSVVIADAALAISALCAIEFVDPQRAGAVGHSMGGHTVLFSAALDDRVRFACVSGAACSYLQRITAQTGIELAQVIPGILSITDFDGLTKLIAPRPLLIVSGSEDPYSRDASAIVESAAHTYATLGARNQLQHVRYRGSHPLTDQRVTTILDWTTSAPNKVLQSS